MELKQVREELGRGNEKSIADMKEGCSVAMQSRYEDGASVQ